MRKVSFLDGVLHGMDVVVYLIFKEPCTKRQASSLCFYHRGEVAVRILI